MGHESNREDDPHSSGFLCTRSPELRRDASHAPLFKVTVGTIVNWRNIAITVIDRVVSIDACLQEYVRVASLHVKRNPVCKPDGIMAGHVLGTMAHNRMNDNVTQSIRESYDRLADEYARRIFNELQQKPLDRELLSRFAAEIARGGEVCDIGCGPGHVARYLHDAGAAIFGLDISPRMLAQARQLNPDISFHEGNMMALDLQDGTLAGISAFYAIVNIPKTSLPSVFREMRRVLQPGGLLLLAFRTGDEILHEDELWVGMSPWISSFFRHWQSNVIWKPRVLQSRKSLSASLIRPRSSTKAEGRTFLHGSQAAWRNVPLHSQPGDHGRSEAGWWEHMPWSQLAFVYAHRKEEQVTMRTDCTAPGGGAVKPHV
jgi:ubiquinone/menaquinone biosynthesis C-methylase UbiE